MPIPLVSDKRRASSGEDNQYEQALPTHGVLSDFFDVTKNSASIFEASAIMKTEYASYINTYPTIFLSFADAKESKRRIVKSIKEQLLNVYDEYACVLEKLSMFEKPKFDLILRGLSDLEDENLEPVDHAISFLTCAKANTTLSTHHRDFKNDVMLLYRLRIGAARPRRDTP